MCMNQTRRCLPRLLQAGTLRDRIARSMGSGRRSYSDVEALQWLLDVARALHFLHSCQPAIIHRDIKVCA